MGEIGTSLCCPQEMRLSLSLGDLKVDSGCNSNHCLALNELRYKDHHHISLN
ncbi:hypothetical protein J6590_092419 [Homalodisca vitripennis]|nr:hypothetical protein J6590_092419 [Homalodisca vitripennis]